MLLEASNGVGGRVRTDHVDGFTLDRGFAIFLTSYPETQVQPAPCIRRWPALLSHRMSTCSQGYTTHELLMQGSMRMSTLLQPTSGDPGGMEHGDEDLRSRAVKFSHVSSARRRRCLTTTRWSLNPSMPAPWSRYDGGFHRVADPLRHPADGVLSLFNPVRLIMKAEPQAVMHRRQRPFCWTCCVNVQPQCSPDTGLCEDGTGAMTRAAPASLGAETPSACRKSAFCTEHDCRGPNDKRRSAADRQPSGQGQRGAVPAQGFAWRRVRQPVAARDHHPAAAPGMVAPHVALSGLHPAQMPFVTLVYAWMAALQPTWRST